MSPTKIVCEYLELVYMSYIENYTIIYIIFVIQINVRYWKFASKLYI